MQPQEIETPLLRLDPANPRIPLSVQGQDQATLFLYLHEHGVLTELVDSFVDNGFFANEPLLVVADAPTEAGEPSETFTVVEGNRRLAALLWMQQIPPGDSIPLDRDIPAARLKRVERVPVVVVDSRDSVSAFLGFRHISGLKPWPPEAKARYIAKQVDEASEDQRNPFAAVGRAFGSNATGMRNAYLAYRTLEFARNEHRLDVGHVMNERFGVWTRCLNSGNIREYFGLGRPTAYSEVTQAIQQLDGAKLGEVIADLSPRGSRPPLLADSREITSYGKVLASPEARRVLRQTDNFNAAKMLILDSDLATKLFRVGEQAKAILREMLELEQGRPELKTAADQLLRTCKNIRLLVDGLEDSELSKDPTEKGGRDEAGR